MQYLRQLLRATALLAGLAVFSYATASAQAATHAQSTATPKVAKSSRTSMSSKATPRVTSFRAIAPKLNTTPEALESAYKTAAAANRKLTRGQFIVANVLAQNLGAKNPGITTDAILDGVKSGKSIGKTLQGLGLSPTDADKAQDEANSEIRQAARQSSHQSKESREPRDSTKSN